MDNSSVKVRYSGSLLPLLAYCGGLGRASQTKVAVSTDGLLSCDFSKWSCFAGELVKRCCYLLVWV